MGAELAKLGVYPKEKGEKVYYVNRLDFGFSIKINGEDGKPKVKKNPNTGQDLFDSYGNPQYIETPVMFTRWHERFTDLGYWCVYKVGSNTTKEIAEELERMAKSNKHQVMNEKAFIAMTNPALGKHMDDTERLKAEKDALEKSTQEAREEKNRLDQEIARLKVKAGIK